MFGKPLVNGSRSTEANPIALSAALSELQKKNYYYYYYFWVLFKRPIFLEINPGWDTSPEGLPKNLWELPIQDFLQARCSSCHPSTVSKH